MKSTHLRDTSSRLAWIRKLSVRWPLVGLYGFITLAVLSLTLVGHAMIILPGAPFYKWVYLAIAVWMMTAGAGLLFYLARPALPVKNYGMMLGGGLVGVSLWLTPWAVQILGPLSDLSLFSILSQPEVVRQSATNMLLGIMTWLGIDLIAVLIVITSFLFSLGNLLATRVAAIKAFQEKDEGRLAGALTNILAAPVVSVLVAVAIVAVVFLLFRPFSW